MQPHDSSAGKCAEDHDQRRPCPSAQLKGSGRHRAGSKIGSDCAQENYFPIAQTDAKIISSSAGKSSTMYPTWQSAVPQLTKGGSASRIIEEIRISWTSNTSILAVLRCYASDYTRTYFLLLTAGLVTEARMTCWLASYKPSAGPGPRDCEILKRSRR
jgi:hypothetical protein